MRRWIVAIPILLLLLAVLLFRFPAPGGIRGWLSGRAPGGPSGETPAKTPGAPVGNTSGPAPAPGCQPGQAGDYFPYQLGTQATYAGLGNEFASYKVKVIHQSGNKVEWRRDNGGTVMAEVYQVTPQQVTRIYREGEAYDANPRLNLPPNQSEPILKGPIQVGTAWTAGNTTYTIQSVNASVQALNQTLTCVVVVEGQSPSALIRTYYHKQYGLLLTIFDPNGNPIESRLAAFTP